MKWWEPDKWGGREKEDDRVLQTREKERRGGSQEVKGEGQDAKAQAKSRDEDCPRAGAMVEVWDNSSADQWKQGHTLRGKRDGETAYSRSVTMEGKVRDTKYERMCVEDQVGPNVSKGQSTEKSKVEDNLAVGTIVKVCGHQGTDQWNQGRVSSINQVEGIDQSWGVKIGNQVRQIHERARLRVKNQVAPNVVKSQNTEKEGRVETEEQERGETEIPREEEGVVQLWIEKEDEGESETEMQGGLMRETRGWANWVQMSGGRKRGEKKWKGIITVVDKAAVKAIIEKGVQVSNKIWDVLRWRIVQGKDGRPTYDVHKRVMNNSKGGNIELVVGWIEEKVQVEELRRALEEIIGREVGEMKQVEREGETRRRVIFRVVDRKEAERVKEIGLSCGGEKREVTDKVMWRRVEGWRGEGGDNTSRQGVEEKGEGKKDTIVFNGGGEKGQEEHKGRNRGEIAEGYVKEGEKETYEGKRDKVGEENKSEMETEKGGG